MVKFKTHNYRGRSILWTGNAYTGPRGRTMLKFTEYNNQAFITAYGYTYIHVPVCVSFIKLWPLPKTNCDRLRSQAGV